MEPILIITAVIAAWLVIALIVAVVFGRVARAGEHERQMDAMRREVVHPPTNDLSRVDDDPVSTPRRS